MKPETFTFDEAMSRHRCLKIHAESMDCEDCNDIRIAHRRALEQARAEAELRALVALLKTADEYGFAEAMSWARSRRRHLESESGKGEAC